MSMLDAQRLGGLSWAIPTMPSKAQPSQSEVFARNAPYMRPGNHSFNTSLPVKDETAFRSWIAQNKVPFNADAGVTDYDMRGFYQALQAGDPRATSAVNPNDNQMHYPDYWKTPYHQSFSQDSQWAGPTAPQWNAADQLVAPSGRILYDEQNTGGGGLLEMLGLR